MNEDEYVDYDDLEAEESQKALLEERHKELADVRELARSAYGRRIIWRLMEFCRLFDHGFTGNAKTYFKCGRRSVALWFFNEIVQAEPDPTFIGELLMLMQKEDHNV